MKNILAIDPGSQMGLCWSLEEKGQGLLKWGQKEKRWKYLYDTLKKVIEKHNIQKIYCEDNFYAKFISTRLFFGRTLCIIDLLGEQLDIPVIYVNPSSLKKFNTGKGNAAKDEMIDAVNEKTGLTIVSHDIADAVAVFLYAKSKEK